MTMIYCISCLLPETKPDLSFDSSGVCAACLAYNNRKQIDWKSREEEFFRIIDKFRTTKKKLMGLCCSCFGR